MIGIFMRFIFKPKIIAVCLLVMYAQIGMDDIRHQPMTLYVGQSEFISDSGIRKVAVGSDEILSAVGIDNKGVLITGMKSGDTTIKVWRKNSLQTINTHVYPANLIKMKYDIENFMNAYPNTSVRILGDKIVVEGDDLDVASKAKIDVFLSGFNYVTNLTSAKTLEPDVTDQRMIYFDVKILEVSRSNMENLGIQWDTQVNGPSIAIAGEFKKSSKYVDGLSGVPSGAKIAPFASYAGLISSIASRVNLMESQGLARLVAHPVLSCKNGGSAKFLSGGQMPYNAASATGTPSVDFKEYGISLDVRPVIQADGSIVANISAEVSEVDTSVVIDGVPGLLTRKTQTEFSLQNAQTIVLSGLNSLQNSTAHASVPGVSKIPLFGGLFRNKATTDKQTELLFIVTPIIYSESPMQETIFRANDIIQKSNANNQLLPIDFFNSLENRIEFDTPITAP